MSVSPKRWLQSAAALVLGVSAAGLSSAYSPVPVTGVPVAGPGMLPTDMVWGKEYSHDLDITGGPGAPTLDPQQVILWDGVGGTANGVDYTGTRPSHEEDLQVDAIANSRDALFGELRRDAAGLVFSHDDEIFGYTSAGGPAPIPVPSAGPITLSSGIKIGGAGELSMELAGAFAPPTSIDVWAPQPAIDARTSSIDDRPLPRDVDGVEVWGPELGENEAFRGDADKYSMELDFMTGFSIWNAGGTPYAPHSVIVDAVETLLGPTPDGAFLPFEEQVRGRNAINLDALMVLDTVGSTQQFDRDSRDDGGELFDQERTPLEPNERGDSIIFSIRQMWNPDGTLYATGSELFVLDSFGGVEFLDHGGHVWDPAFATSMLSLDGLVIEDHDIQVQRAVIDINAIEAVGELREFPVGLPGDYNGDGKVDAADYTVWRDSKGTSGFGLPADGDGDGVVDSDDYDIWRGNYGAMAASPAMALAVPEPATGALVLVTLCGLGVGRRR